MDGQDYLHYSDTRTNLEKQLSNHIVRGMSALNIQRIRSIASPDITTTSENFYFVCLSGIPSVEGEFDQFGFKEKTVIPFEGYFGNYSTEQYIKMFK